MEAYIYQFGSSFPILGAALIIGETYRHKEFGKGNLLSVKKKNDDFQIVVNFEGIGIKHLMARSAKLRRLVIHPQSDQAD